MAEAPPAEKPFKEFIPTEFHDRPYLKDFLDKNDSPETRAALFNKLDGAEKLIGKKTVDGIPAADAKPEDIEKFYAKLRAEKPEDYEYKLGDKPDEVFDKELRAAAHKAGLSKKQMAEFVGTLAPGMQAREAAALAERAKLDKEFTDMQAAAFGPENEKVIARVKEAIKEYAPENVKQHADKLDNAALTILAGVINSVLVKYVPEDKLNGKDKGESAGGDKAALQTEARALQTSEAWKNFQHPDHDKTKKRVAEIYASAAFK
jgi:hypothetical protein